MDPLDDLQLRTVGAPGNDDITGTKDGRAIEGLGDDERAVT